MRPVADARQFAAAGASTAWNGHERRTGNDSDGALRLLDEIDYGIVVVDAQLRVLFVNHAARTQLRLQPELRIEHGCLLASTARDTAQMGVAVRAAALQRLRRMLVLGQAAQRIMLAVVPVPAGPPGAPQRSLGRVMVMLPRHQICEPLSIHGFARDHGLSHAEGQVLVSLCKGLQPSEVARQQGVAISTVRTQIASLRQKTGAATVADLVHQIARLPPICSALPPEARGSVDTGLGAGMAA